MGVPPWGLCGCGKRRMERVLGAMRPHHCRNRLRILSLISPIIDPFLGGLLVHLPPSSSGTKKEIQELLVEFEFMKKKLFALPYFLIVRRPLT